jgi:DegV family protein with EDD domain
MEKIAIITDSCADVSAQDREQYDIYVMPMVVQCQDGEYKDGVTITAEEVYEKQINEVIKTASPTGEDIMGTFEQVKKNGYTHAIVVLLASGLSGTYNQVRLMAQSEEALEITVLDGKSGSVGYGAVVRTLAQYRDQGLGYEELLKKAEQLIANTFVYFSLDSLVHLERGGRIGKATAFVGGVMKIKPILSFTREEGEIMVPAKVHGRRAVMPKLVELVEKRILEHPNLPFHLIVAHGGLPEEREVLEMKLRSMYPQLRSCIQTKIGAALSAYLGSGLLGAGVQFLEE